MLNETEIAYWRCHCEYRVANLVYKYARFNYACPRCRVRNLSDYLPVLCETEQLPTGEEE